MSEITLLREEIAKIDEEIVRLAGARNNIAKKIGELKIVSGTAITDSFVEEKVLERYRSFGKIYGVSEDAAEKLARVLIDEAVSVQELIL